VQARSEISRFGAQNKFLGMQDFCFHKNFHNKNFSEHIKIWGTQKI